MNQNFLTLMRSRIPSSMQTQYPLFTYLVMQYFRWLNYQYIPGNSLNDYSNLIYEAYGDNDYRQKVLNDLGFELKSNVNSDMIYSLVDQFMNSRGTVNSFKLLFLLVYGANVDITYPRDNMCYLSAANWSRTNWMCITGDVDLEEDSVFGAVQGATSKVYAGIESYFPIYIHNRRYYMIELTYNSESFTVGEPIKIRYGNKNYYEVNVPLIKPIITSVGHLYKNGDEIQIISDYSGKYKVASVELSSVTSMTITNGGTGYIVGDIITSVPNNGFFATVSAVNSSGTITAIFESDGGRSFAEIPEFNVISATGTGAILSGSGNSIGAILTINTIIPSVSLSSSSISIISDNGSGAAISTAQVATIPRSRWIDSKGFLGVNSTIQDSAIVHEYAYTIESNINTNVYLDDVKNYVHPAGFSINNHRKEEVNTTISPTSITTITVG